MKYLVLFFIALFFVVNLSAQQCSLPNPSFENHSSLDLGSDTIEVPNGYNPFLTLLLSVIGGGAPGVDTTHDAYSGNLALELYRDTANNVLFGGDVLAILPCSQYPSLNGYYKLENPALGDSAVIGIVATGYDTLNNRRDTVINEALVLGAVANYTAFHFTPIPNNFSTDIDTIQFLLAYLPQGDLTSFKIDSLTLNTFVVGLDEELSDDEQSEASIKVFPNPSKGQFRLEVEEVLNFPLQISNMNGQIIYEKLVISQNSLIDLSAFPDGMYFLKYGEEIRKVVVTK